MKNPNGRELKVLFILSIVGPVGIFISLRLTGVLHEPPLENIEVEPINWQINRPSGHVYIKESVENNYTSSEVSARIGVFIGSYQENSRDAPFAYRLEGRDGIIFQPSVNLTTMEGFVESILIKFQLLEVNASLFVHSYREGINPPLKEYNTRVTEVRWYTENLGTAFIRAQALQSSVGLETQVYWVFDDENDQGHQLEVTLEIMYFDGETHKKMAVPIVLAVLTQPA